VIALNAYRCTGRLGYTLHMNPKAMPVRLAFAALLLSGSHIATAKEHGHWCSITDQGSNNCSFDSVARCLKAVSAAGGYCMRQAQMDDRPRPAADDLSNEAINNQKQNRDLPIDIHICRGC
jgi:hypothetical protein